MPDHPTPRCVCCGKFTNGESPMCVSCWDEADATNAAEIQAGWA